MYSDSFEYPRVVPKSQFQPVGLMIFSRLGSSVPLTMVAPADSITVIRERRVETWEGDVYCQNVSQGRPNRAPLREDLEVRWGM